MAPIALDTSGAEDRNEQRPYVRAAINLYPNPDDDTKYIQSLPELIEFNAKANPSHVFCIQAHRQKQTNADSTRPVSLSSIRITNTDLKTAILACQKWLIDNMKALQLPVIDVENGTVRKGAPVALLMDSDVGLWIHKMALIGLGVPVLLLSARLSATAVHHLVNVTESVAIFASRRLQSVATEACDLLSAENSSIPIYLPEPYTTFISTSVHDQTLSICHPNHYFSETDRNVLILHSSGTTGLPKPIYVSHRHLVCFTTCHNFENEAEAQGVNVSTLPLFHGFGLVAPALAMGVGKTVCFPATATVPNALSVVELLKMTNAASLMTVPSILEDLSLMKDSEGTDVLAKLDFVTFGGGLLKPAVGDRLSESGVNILNHYGATESGPLAPIFVPKSDYNWRYFRLRQDVKMTITEVPTDTSQDGDQRLFKLTTYPFGWEQPFEIQDRLICNPEHPKTDFNAVGRKDDWIVLATGEKVLPQILESMLVDSGLVKTALMFGEHRFEAGVLVQPNKSLTSAEEMDNLKTTIWPIVVKAAERMDAHARLSSLDSIVVIPADGVIPRTDKGSIARKELYKAYEKEIDEAYHKLETNQNSTSVLIADDRLWNGSNLEEALKLLIQNEFKLGIALNEWTYDDDLFELGLNSLQATLLRRHLLSLVSIDSTDAIAAEEPIGRDFVYANPSIRRICHAIRKKKHGGSVLSVSSITQQVDSLVAEFGLQIQSTPRAVVLLTGATGSLGSHCLAQLAVSEDVSRVICLNRPHKETSDEPNMRQKRALSARGIDLPEEVWANKVQVLESNSPSELLGLPWESYRGLQKSITHIVHAAWPMDFKWKLASFQGQFRALEGLLRLAHDAQTANTFHERKTRFIFVSSVATVGQYSTIQKQRIIPEDPVRDITCVNDIGYAQAKYVCERLIEQAAANYGNKIEAAYIRLGQIAGASHDGQWNKDEHFPALLKSSQAISALPNLPGTLSWMPVNRIAEAITEISLSPEPLRLAYHIENPVRQSWSDILHLVGQELSIKTSIPFEEWLDQVSKADCPDEENPSKQLLEFFQQDFIRMACGEVIMGTDETRKASRTMSMMDALEEDDVLRYIEYWKRIGFLN